MLSLISCASIATPVESYGSERDDIEGKLDYNHYIKKIWVLDDWTDFSEYPFSFFITTVEENTIEGKIQIGAIAEPDFFYYRMQPSVYLGSFAGTIENNIARCEFSTEDGNSGVITLNFNDKTMVEAAIEYLLKSEPYQSYENGRYLFRPYNISDIDNIVPDKVLCLEVDLNSWGNVRFITVETDTGKIRHSKAYLIDENENILYEFRAPFSSAFEVVEIEVNDINSDGLKDIMIISQLTYEDKYEDTKINYIFYQLESGLFYNSALEDGSDQVVS